MSHPLPARDCPDIRVAVESAMSVRTDLYVRDTLPLGQAREAMASKGVKVR